MRVLIVEDEPGVAAFLEQGLSEAGYAVDVARNGEDGLAYARAASYDLLLLDIMLPRKSGAAVCCEELRAQGDETPVLLLTARDADRGSGARAGCGRGRLPGQTLLLCRAAGAAARPDAPPAAPERDGAARGRPGTEHGDPPGDARRAERWS